MGTSVPRNLKLDTGDATAERMRIAYANSSCLAGSPIEATFPWLATIRWPDEDREAKGCSAFYRV